MQFKYLHPCEEIIEIINRIYQNGMTTTSGGNLSIKDSDGSIWITPKGIDKGKLTTKDIVRVLPDGSVDGIHEPSSELPFHKAIFDSRSDIKAIVHAHPPDLVSFSIARKIPDTKIVPKASEICGKVGYAEYQLPGSEKLGEVIASKFKEGHNTVLLENHGIVTVGDRLVHAFQKLEILNFCARLTIKANIIGNVKVLSDEQLELSRNEFSLEEFDHNNITSHEKDLRQRMIKFIHRSYSQKLMTSLEGTFSAKVDDEKFIITPWGKDRKYLREEDLVLINNSKKERGKKPSRSVKIHDKLYKKHPGIKAVIIAHPPNILAFGVSDAKFDSRTIPESYILLRDIPKLPFGMEFENNEGLVEILSENTPVVICENNCVIVTGGSLLEAYDRLEVAEYSAKSVIAAKAIGGVVPIGNTEINELKKAFGLGEGN